MSNDSQIPENPPNGNPPDFSKDSIEFKDNRLWELDDNSADSYDEFADLEKSYGMMEKTISKQEPVIAAAQDDRDVESPNFLRGLTAVEKISMILIFASLAVTATLAVIHFSKEIPVDSEISKKVSLPVEGKMISVSAVETYWRSPNTQGENADIVRTGVKLIPVVKIQASGKSGAIRIFFRDSDGSLVGDSTTLTISGKQSLTISATDGFTDMGMHASYRTGENARWMIQVLEGPSIDAPIEKFKTLFETEISTDIR